MKAIVFVLMLLVPSGWQSTASGDEWPRVRDFEASFEIDTSAERILIVLPIHKAAQPVSGVRARSVDGYGGG